MNNNDTIADALDLVPLHSNNKQLTVKSCDDEYEQAKQNMDTIVSVGTSALSELAQMASLSQDPRVYRVLTELISAMTSANKEIIEMKKTNSEIKQKSEQDKPQTINNNLVVASTAELAKMLEGIKNK